MNVTKRVLSGLINGVLAIGLCMAVSAGLVLISALIFGADNSLWVRTAFAILAVGTLAWYIYEEVTETDEADGDETDD